MFFKRVKNCINTFLAIAVALLVGLCLLGMRGTRFPTLEGARTFYLDSPSSQATAVSSLSLLDIFRVRGESVALDEGEAEEALASLSAEVLFVEEVGGVRSYYCYSPNFFDFVQVGEYLVNLHVAVGAGRCVVGSPIIFGGF